MYQLRVSLFGKFVVQDAERGPVSFSSHKEEELFCFLVLNRGRPYAREALASMLWGETTTAQSKKYLRTTLWKLRTDLNTPADATSLLTTSNRWVQLYPEANIWTDVDVLERTYERFHGRTGADLSSEDAASLREAIELYRGDLLEGWYQDWCLCERERLQQLYFRLVDLLMGYCEVHRDFDLGLACGLRMLSQEPARERAHRRMMRLYYLSGDRYSALKQYERCHETLREELDVAPSRLTQSLYEQIRADRLDDMGDGVPQLAPGQVATGPSSSLRSLLGSIGQLQVLLANMQEQLQHEIEGVEAVSR